MEKLNIAEFFSKSSGIEIGCSKCGEFFSAKSANLFDIRQPYPRKAIEAFRLKELQIKAAWKSVENKKKQFDGKLRGLKEKEFKLRHRKKERPKIVKVITKHINIGQIIEKILPASPKYKYNISDCRSVFDPIDYIAFNGFSKGNTVNDISIIEVKTGDANLQRVQKQIKATLQSGKVSLRTY